MGSECLSRARWPSGRWAEMLRGLLARNVHSVSAQAIARLEPFSEQREASRWLRDGARQAGFDAEVDPTPLAMLDRALRWKGSYVLVCVDGERTTWFALAVVRTSLDRCLVLGPDGSECRIQLSALLGELADAMSERLSRVGVAADDEHDGHLLQRLILERERGECPFLVARYALDGAQPFLSQLRMYGVQGRVVAYFAITALQGLTTAVAAVTLGASAITGVVDAGRILGWSLLIASQVPLQYLAITTMGEATLDIATALKKRLLEGALRIDEEQLRRHGVGRQIARLNEVGTIEQLSISQVLGVLPVLGQMCAAVVLLNMGALATVQLATWGAFVFGAIVLGAVFFRRYSACYELRLLQTEDIVEKTAGHRTRAVQANPNTMHTSEDVQLLEYANEVTNLNRVGAVTEVYGRIWLTASGAVLIGAFIFGASGVALLTTAIGAYLAATAFTAVLAVAREASTWWCAWKGIAPLFNSGQATAGAGPIGESVEGAGRTTVLSSVSFAYQARDVLSNVNLRIEAGDRILVTGPSGGGKTTLSKLLTGELRAKHGSVLVNGIDRASVSAATWRRRVASSPQFHENLVFSNTFAFNVDPRGAEGELSPEARAVCFELGLKDLLGRMPSRAAQLVGETGWQLSHGERSRVFIARTLLQGADLVILDESFAALDPECLAVALRCVQSRARTLITVAHQ